jgi:hypothetical protein
MRRVQFSEDGYVKQEGWFHAWAGTSELAYALVEKDDGDIVRVKYSDIRFLPSRQALNLELWEA